MQVNLIRDNPLAAMKMADDEFKDRVFAAHHPQRFRCLGASCSLCVRADEWENAGRRNEKVQRYEQQAAADFFDESHESEAFS